MKIKMNRERYEGMMLLCVVGACATADGSLLVAALFTLGAMLGLCGAVCAKN
jgi:hypothetical protein